MYHNDTSYFSMAKQLKVHKAENNTQTGDVFLKRHLVTGSKDKAIMTL